MTGAPDLHALVVGIDRYQPPPSAETVLYRSLRGAAADARAVERYLRELLRVPAEQIERLTASGLGSEPEEPRSEWPTYERLVAALRALEERTGPGDQALVFFAGHGGRASTAWPHLKGHGQLDEGLAPVDVQRAGGRYLRDGELAAWVDRQRDRGVFVTVILDCCHAGGLRRLPVGVRIRGPVEPVDRRDSSPEDFESLLADEAEIHRALDHRSRWGSAALQGSPVWRENAVLLAACRDVEQAIEDSFGDEHQGVLSHYLLEALERIGEKASWRHLHAMVATRVRGRVRRQTPCLVGDGERRIFGRERLPVLWGVDVLRPTASKASKVLADAAGPGEPEPESESDREVWIATGSAQGIFPGARFDLYPLAAARRARPQSPLGRGRVMTAEAGRCRLEPEGDAPSWSRVEAGGRAVLVDPGDAVARQRVAVEVADGADSAATELSDRCHRFLESPASPRLAGVEPGSAADLRLLLDSGSTRKVRILSGTGEPLPHVPEISLAGVEAASPALDAAERHLKTILEHLGRYFSLLALGEERLASPLARQVEVNLAEPPADAPAGATAPGRAFAAVPPLLPPERPFQLVVENHGLEHLNVAVLNFAPDWSVHLARQSRLRRLERGRPYVVSLKTYLPPGFPGGIDVLKVFFTRDEMDFGWMVQPSLEDALAGEIPRWRSAPPPSSMPVADSLSRARRLLGAQPRYRGRDATDLRDWVTTQVELRVERDAE